MNEPLISIITPTYNHKLFVKECIESVINQTYANWEMIIVDDFSNDGTSEIVDKYRKKDKRILTIRHKKNYGIYRLSESYNEALKIARGEFIAILEGDDYWPKDKLEKQIVFFSNDKVVLVWGEGAYVNEENKIIKQMPFPKINSKSMYIYQNRPVGIILKKLLLENVIVPAASVMLRKSTILSIDGFKQLPNISYVDYPTWLELSLKGEFRFSDYILGYWRIHSSQVTANLLNEQIFGRSRIALKFCNTLPIGLKKYLGINDRPFEVRYYWFKGRSNLLVKDWENAQNDFIKVVLKGSLLMKAKGIIGIFSSFLKIDIIKYLTKIANRDHYSGIKNEN
jgi:glycosyltransferase involved in cell wall biosynthesis